MKRPNWSKEKRREHVRKGMFILPSLFTVANIFCGFLSVSNSIKENYELAGLLIGIAMVLDTLDGRIARMTHTSSAFGVQLDSLADVITFGIAPAVLCYQWAFYHFENFALDRAGWLASFIFLICAASRLARFNVQTSGVHDKRYFIGMPTPAAAGFVASTIYCFPDRLDGNRWAIAAVCMMIFLAFLMVSKIKYRTFKDLDLRQPRSYRTIAVIGIIFAAMYFDLKRALITLAVLYTLSGLIEYVWGWRHKREAPAEHVAEHAPEQAPEPINPS